MPVSAGSSMVARAAITKAPPSAVAPKKVREASARARVYDALGTKYFGATDHAEFINVFGQVDDPDTVYVRLVPDVGLTWEY